MNHTSAARIAKERLQIFAANSRKKPQTNQNDLRFDAQQSTFMRV